MTYQDTLHSAHVERMRRLARKPEPVVKAEELAAVAPEPEAPAEVACLKAAKAAAPRPVPKPNVNDEVPTVPTMPKISEVQLAASRYYGVTVVDMISRRRDDPVVLPRHIAMYLCRKMTGHSLPIIGRHFGGRDHTTVMHAIKKIEWLLPFDRELSDSVLAIEVQLSVGRVA